MDFNTRLDSLKKRRQGPSEFVINEALDSVTGTASNREFIRKSESFEELKEPEAVKYTIGAMAAVDSKYTEISIREGERVANSLSQSLLRENISIDTRLQGSVGLDVHIKGYSDVDMLVLVSKTILVERPHIQPSSYLDATDQRPMVDIVGELRVRSEDILTRNFPVANVDVSGAKAISLEGGSLARQVDIVPAAWFHTIAYQSSKEDYDLGVQILNKKDSVLIKNFPFLNRKLINDADLQVNGNLKRVVRLIKNLQADAEGVKEFVLKKLNSFDVLSIAYDMRNELAIPSYNQLGLVVILVEKLRYMVMNRSYCEELKTPDFTRKVFDHDDKYGGLSALYLECQELADSLAAELNPLKTKTNREVLLGKAVFG
jgi:hypothetical protein